MKQLIFVLSYVPVLLLSLTYLTHGFYGIFQHPEHVYVVKSLGFEEAAMVGIVIFGGVLDLLISFLLLLKKSILSSLQWLILFLYAGLWPAVPRAVEWYKGSDSAVPEAVIFMVLAALAYFLHIRRNLKINRKGRTIAA